MFSFKKILLLMILLAWPLSCLYPERQGSPPSGQSAGQNKRRAVVPKAPPDPKKQEECRKQSQGACGDDQDCQSVCADIFRTKSNRKHCGKLPKDFVLAFELSLKQVERGDAQDLDLEVLDCLLDIDVKAFTNALKRLNRNEAKDFLYEITDNEDLAKILKNEDDNFRIFNQLFEEAGIGAGLNQILSEEIEGDKGFLWLSSEGNRYAFDWLDEYVAKECPSSLCPQEQNLGAYCAELVRLSDSDLRDFLEDGDVFAREYERDILNQDFDYDSAGFRRFCSDQFSSSSAGNPRSPSSPDPPTPTCSIPNFCSRTAEVQTAILGRLSGKTCCTVTQADLDTIVTELRVPLDPHIRAGYARCQRTATLQAGDLQGLRRLTHIDFANSCLRDLPSGIFSGMDDLEEIEFGQGYRLGLVSHPDNPNRGFPTDVFDGLSNLQRLKMPECAEPCSTIPACDNLPNRVTVTQGC